MDRAFEKYHGRCYNIWLSPGGRLYPDDNGAHACYSSYPWSYNFTFLQLFLAPLSLYFLTYFLSPSSFHGFLFHVSSFEISTSGFFGVLWPHVNVIPRFLSPGDLQKADSLFNKPELSHSSPSKAPFHYSSSSFKHSLFRFPCFTR